MGCECQALRLLLEKKGVPNALRCPACVDAIIESKNELVRELAYYRERLDRLVVHERGEREEQ